MSLHSVTACQITVRQRTFGRHVNLVDSGSSSGIIMQLKGPELELCLKETGLGKEGLGLRRSGMQERQAFAVADSGRSCLA